MIERSHEALKDHQRRLGAGQPEVKIDLPLDDDLKAIVDALEFRPTLESILLIQLLRNQKPNEVD